MRAEPPWSPPDSGSATVTDHAVLNAGKDRFVVERTPAALPYP